MTLGLWPQMAGIIEMIPSLPIHSSVLIPLVAGLFLAALILRAQRLPKQSEQQHRGMTTRQARAARRRAYRSGRLRSAGRDNRGTQMSSIDAKESGRPNTQASSPGAQPFRIHWGRTILAAVGLVALLIGIGSALAVPFVTAMTWTVPGVSATVLLAALVSLQVTAARRRRAQRRDRVERAMREAMNPHPQVRQQPHTPAAAEETDAQEQPSTAVAADGRRSGPFDALSADPAGNGGPDSLVTFDADGLPDSADRLFSQPDSPTPIFNQTPSVGHPASTSGESWDVRTVPAAHYMVAAKAERPAPEPLEEQDPVRSSDVKLKQPAASPEKPAPSSGPQESINLDQVLQRRRA
ncbi:hypothetical protein [Nesterenkonia haasae]|uniref:hypothetical protein n=1 Tax=Nesterenkonia haasae TaxID=2587813 RepID=UPI00139134DB|nr:hypothetical protein [Nesterenkonia haasae]NDK30938.1 hypothetical protein [Nesterenkonia haasae]